MCDNDASRGSARDGVAGHLPARRRQPRVNSLWSECARRPVGREEGFLSRGRPDRGREIGNHAILTSVTRAVSRPSVS